VVVALLRPGEAFEFDRESPVLRQTLRAVEQRVKDRIAVETRHAAPDDGAALVDEGADGAIADERDVEAGGWQ